MPQVQDVWKKLNPRERTTTWGAFGVALGWIIGLAGSYGLGGNTIALVGAIAVVVILFLKYSPNQAITWPAPVSLIILGISAVVAVLGLLALLGLLQLLGLAGGFFATAIIAAIVTAVGAALMVWGAWQEYQLTKPATAGGATPPATAPGQSAWAPPPPAPPVETMEPASASKPDDIASQ